MIDSYTGIVRIPFSHWTEGWTVPRNDLAKALSRFLALDPGEAPAPGAKRRATGEGAKHPPEAEALETQAPQA